ncbi:45182_t:CDS:2, partial [Gigaspora margarita]
LGLEVAEIQEAELLTSSDHKIVVASLSLKHLIKTYSKAETKKRGLVRTIFLYDKASKENWKSYQVKLERIIRRNKVKLQACFGSEVDQSIDEAWEIISNALSQAAKKHIPRKKILKTNNQTRFKGNKSLLHKDIIELSKIIQLVRKKYVSGLLLEKQEKANKIVSKIKKEYSSELTMIINTDSASLFEWVFNARSCWKSLRKLERLEEEKLTHERIKKAVDRRYERIVGEPGKILASILEKPLKKVSIDRVLEQLGNKRVLYNEPSEVLDRTRLHYQNQFKEREIGDSRELVNEFYKSLKEVDKRWYGELAEEISLDECRQFTALQNRLNGHNRLSELTLLRKTDGFLLASLTDKSWELTRIEVLKKIWKNNLSNLVLLKASEHGITVRSDSNPWKIFGTGPQIYEMLNDKVYLRYYKSFEKYNLFYVNQLLDSKEKIVRDRQTREVVDSFICIEDNMLSMEIRAKRMSEDMRKRN